jgi:hypothetical protein
MKYMIINNALVNGELPPANPTLEKNFARQTKREFLKECKTSENRIKSLFVVQKVKVSKTASSRLNFTHAN